MLEYMEDKTFKFFKNSLLLVIGILLTLLVITGIVMIFVVNTEATTSTKISATTYPSSTVNIYKFEETKKVVQEVPPTQSIYTTPTTDAQKLNVETTVHVHTQENSYYPRYNRDYRYYPKYPRHHTYTYRHVNPYGVHDKNYRHYGGYNRYYRQPMHVVRWGRY